MANKKSLLAFASVLALSFVLVGVEAAFACEGGGDTMWAMFRHNWHRTGFSGCTVSDGASLYRTHNIGADSSVVYMNSTPGTSEGVYYITANNGYVYAFNDTTGSQLWSKYLTGAKSTAMVKDGKLIFGVGGKLAALYLNNGSAAWSRALGGTLLSPPASIPGSTIAYVGCINDKLYAFNTTNGNVIWSYNTGGDVMSSPAVSEDGLVYVGSNSGKLYALNATTGASAWNYSTGSDVKSSPAIVGGKVFFGSDNGYVYALNKTTGSYMWRYQTHGAVSSSPAVYSDTNHNPIAVYIGSDSGYVYALNPSNGWLIWSFPTGGAVSSSPAVTAGKVFIGSADGNLYVLNRTSGSYMNSYNVGMAITTSPTVENSKVFLTAGNMTYVFE